MRVVFLCLFATSVYAAVVKREECGDKVKHCQKIADEEDGCSKESRFYKFMEPNCQATCGFCSFDDDASVCEDEIETKYCEFFQQAGDCEPESAKYKYVSPNCQKTCGECKFDGDNDNCNDKIPSNGCAAFMNQYGGCDSPSVNEYMKANCEKTCGLCKDYNDDPKYCIDTLQTPQNNDPDVNCAQFKTYCKDTTSFVNKAMQEHCQKTCGLC